MTGRDTEANSVLVEFVGAAGVGKSFLSAKVKNILTKRHMPVADCRTISIMKFSPRSALTVLQAAFLAASIKPKTLRIYARAVREIAKLQLKWDVCRQRRGIYLSDEGLIHRLRGFYRGSDRLSMNEIADRLVRHIVVGHVVVVVEASADKIHSRRTARKRPRDKFSRESVAADVQLLQQSIATIVHLQQSLKYDIRMILIDGEDDCFDGVAVEIADVVQTLLIDAVANR